MAIINMALGRLKYHIAVKTKAKNEADNKKVFRVQHLLKTEAGKTLRLTLVGRKDEDILSAQGLSGLRKKRIVRLTREAQKQGMPLSYEDLSALLLSSISTLKRDINILERHGYVIPLKGRRRRIGYRQ